MTTRHASDAHVHTHDALECFMYPSMSTARERILCSSESVHTLTGSWSAPGLSHDLESIVCVSFKKRIHVNEASTTGSMTSHIHQLETGYQIHVYAFRNETAAIQNALKPSSGRSDRCSGCMLPGRGELVRKPGASSNSVTDHEI